MKLKTTRTKCLLQITGNDFAPIFSQKQWKLHEILLLIIIISIITITNNSVVSPRANYTDRATAACRRN
jgi:hypothetical protein